MNTKYKPTMARYKSTGVKRYRNNPLIEALPPIWSPEQMQQLLAWNPMPPTNRDRKKPAYLRVHEVPELRNLVYLLPEYSLYQSVFSVMLRDGYTSRNPMHVSTWQYLHEINHGSLDNLQAPKPINHRATCSLYSGLSGMGKTTYICRLLDNYPKSLQHTKYKSTPFRHLQIVWIKISCPHDGSITGLVRKFFEEVDDVANTNFTNDYFSKKGRNATIPALIGEMSKIAANYFLGILVIDELQNLNRAKTQGDFGMLEFLGNLVDEIGIPIVYIGTPAVTKLFKKNFRTARRANSFGYYPFHNPHPEEDPWINLLNKIWEYNWTDNPVELTPTLCNRFYEHTQGITALVISLYILCQYRCLLEDAEMNENLVDEVALTEMTSVQGALKALRSPDPKVQREFDDLLPEPGWLDTMLDPVQAIQRAIELKNAPPQKTNKKTRKNTKKKKTLVNSNDPNDLRNLSDDMEDAHATLKEMGVTPASPFEIDDIAH